MGMTYDQFWYGDVRVFDTYAKAFKYKKKQENEKLWLQGLYIYDAISTVMSNAFSKNSRAKYPDKPYDLYKDMSDEDDRREQEEKDLKFAEAYMNQMLLAGADWGEPDN